MHSTKWWPVCLFLVLGLLGCSANKDSDIEKIMNKQKLTAEEKQQIKDSHLIEYVEDTYGDIVQITGFEIIPSGPEEPPPYITVKIKDRENGWAARISCELDEEPCKPYDDYLFRTLHEGIQKEIEPALKKAFGSKKDNISYFAFAVVDNAEEKRWTFKKKPDYKKVKSEVPIGIYIHSTATEDANEDYYGPIFTFIQNFKKTKNGLLLDSDYGLHFYKDEVTQDQYRNPFSKITTLYPKDIKKIKSPDELKSYVEKGYMEEYLRTKEWFDRKMGRE